MLALVFHFKENHSDLPIYVGKGSKKKAKQKSFNSVSLDNYHFLTYNAPLVDGNW